MSDPKSFRFTLKAMINKQKTKVLYVEADNHFADVLLSFLALPLGTIIRVLKKHYGTEVPVLGSFTTLYNGLHDLDSGLFLTQDCKNLLLNPVSLSETECRRLKISVDDAQPTKYFKCGDINCSYSNFPDVSMYFSGLKCNCGKPLDEAIYMREEEDSKRGVFITSKVSLIISDDLQVLPSGTGSAVQILRKFGLIDTVGIEERNLTFRFNEIMDLLKGSLLSREPLTEIILGKKPNDYIAAKCEIGATRPVNQIGTCNVKDITVKAILQESTNKLLFVEAGDDFVELLFSLLALPLGGVECLFVSDTSLKNIDNLYKSVGIIMSGKYGWTVNHNLLQYKLPFCYYSKRHFFLPSSKDFPFLYFYPTVGKGFLSPLCYVGSSKGTLVSCYKFPEGQASCSSGIWSSSFSFSNWQASYVKGPAMYMVTDDLTVKPSTTASGLFVLSSLKIPLSDVKELKLRVGLEEAKSILKASLTSSCALTDGLINPLLFCSCAGNWRASSSQDQLSLLTVLMDEEEEVELVAVVEVVFTVIKIFLFFVQMYIQIFRPRGRKRTRASLDMEDRFMDLMESFCTNMDSQLAELVKRIGFRYDAEQKRKAIYEEISGMHFLSVEDKVRVCMYFCRNLKVKDLFSSISPENKTVMVRMILEGRL
ncbi:Unknown protein [Striga hermonthica]|uniref:Uncharacterized protein n=1 Tax=Striga hermonthica TaxID=68872 RepID=A0A9N7MUJ5_STRHE|nr:Unknown protein [Striga hermonthica]